MRSTPLPLYGMLEGAVVEIRAQFVHEIPRLFVRAWREEASGGSFGGVDSAELIDAASRRAEFYLDRGRTVLSVDALAALRKADAKVDAMFVCLFFVPEFDSEVPSGFALFRRTWANNLYLEFLAASPAISGRKVNLAGIGLAGLFETFNTALQLNAGEVWMETTELSAAYYRKVFGLKSQPVDHLILPVKKSFKTLKARIDSSHG